MGKREGGKIIKTQYPNIKFPKNKVFSLRERDEMSL